MNVLCSIFVPFAVNKNFPHPSKTQRPCQTAHPRNYNPDAHPDLPQRDRRGYVRSPRVVLAPSVVLRFHPVSAIAVSVRDASLFSAFPCDKMPYSRGTVELKVHRRRLLHSLLSRYATTANRYRSLYRVTPGLQFSRANSATWRFCT